MRPEAEPWWRQAEADLGAARQNHGLGIYFATSWFAQQAAEKGLKTLYIERRGTLAPRTHDLMFLGGEVSVPAAIAADLAALNPMFDLVRYPDMSGSAPVDEIPEEKAVSDLSAVERVMQWIRSELGR